MVAKCTAEHREEQRSEFSINKGKLMQEIEKWPLDFESISKGDVIAEVQCRAVLKPKDDKDFQLKLLALKEQIERKHADAGVVLTIKITRNSLHVLTDAEASEYNETRQQHALRHFVKSHRRLLGVEIVNLSPEQAGEHDRRVAHSATYMTAIKSARKTNRTVTATPVSERPKLFTE